MLSRAASWHTGELVSRFEDHALWFPLPEIDHTSVIFITQNQDVILSLCEESDRRPAPSPRPVAPSRPCTPLTGCVAGSALPTRPSHAAGKVSIHVSHILSGRCLAKIDWKSVDSSNLTALCYNEVGFASPRGQSVLARVLNVLSVLICAHSLLSARIDCALPRSAGAR